MRAAVALRDVVGEDEHVLVVRIVPPQRDLDGDAVALADHQDRGLDQWLLGAVEVAHECLEPALVEQLLDLVLGAARVGQHDANAGVQERQLAQPMLDPREVVVDHREGLRRGEKGHLGAAPRLARAVGFGRADDLERARDVAVGELGDMLLAVAPDAQLEPSREGVDDGDADAMQAAGDLVGILVELPARVQLGHDDLGRRNALLLVDAGRDAAAVVGHGHRAVGVERHRHPGRMAGQRLVDRVVDDLVDHVVEARAVVGVADVHARALAHRVEAAEHLDRASAVVVRRRLVGIAGGVVVHSGKGLRWGRAMARRTRSG